MGIIQAFAGAVSGTLADQWKDIISVNPFTERTVVLPGVLQQTNAGRGTNYSGSEGVISNGSKIFVPENTAAFIFSQSGIEDVITESGGYEYQNGQESVFTGGGFKKAIISQTKDRFGYGGQTSDKKRLVFVNLREIRGLTFGTKGPLVYHDLFYQTDLEVIGFGSFSVRISDAERFMRNFVPANITSYSFDDHQARSQVLSEFLQSFIDAVNSLSTQHRISELPSQAEEIAEQIAGGSSNAGTWGQRFGFDLVSVGIENIEFTPASRELVKEYSSNRMNVKAYEDISQEASNISAQQKIAQGVQEHGLGTGGGLVFGMGLAQGLNPQNAAPAGAKSSMSYDEQIDTVRKLKGMLDDGLLTEEEFDLKKREVLGL